MKPIENSEQTQPGHRESGPHLSGQIVRLPIYTPQIVRMPIKREKPSRAVETAQTPAAARPPPPSNQKRPLP